LRRNGWPESIGISGRFRPESVAGFVRNTQSILVCSGLIQPFQSGFLALSKLEVVGDILFSCVGLLNQFKLAGGSDGFTPVSCPRYRRLADSQQFRYGYRCNAQSVHGPMT